MNPEQNTTATDSILYGQLGRHGRSAEAAFTEAEARFRKSFLTARESLLFPVTLLREETRSGSLFSLLEGTAFATVGFPQGLDEYLREVPALIFSVSMTFAAIMEVYQEAVQGQEAMYAELTMASYMRRLDFQQVATDYRSAGRRPDTFAGDLKIRDDKVELSSVIIAAEDDLTSFGIYRGELGWDR